MLASGFNRLLSFLSTPEVEMTRDEQTANFVASTYQVADGELEDDIIMSTSAAHYDIDKHDTASTMLMNVPASPLSMPEKKVKQESLYAVGPVRTQKDKYVDFNNPPYSYDHRKDSQGAPKNRAERRKHLQRRANDIVSGPHEVDTSRYDSSEDPAGQRSQFSPETFAAAPSLPIKGVASLGEEHSLRLQLENDVKVARDYGRSVKDSYDVLKDENARLRQELEHNRRDAERRYNHLYKKTQESIIDERKRHHSIICEKDALIQHLQGQVDEQRETRRRLADKLKLRQSAAVDDLKMDDFDNSIDRVSEADLISRLENVDSSIDEFITELLEMFSGLSHNNSTAWIRGPIPAGSSPLLKAALTVIPNSEAWGMLVDAYMHQKLVTWLYLFASPFGVPSTDSDYEAIHWIDAQVTRTQNWRASQRWRSMTAQASRELLPDHAWAPFIAQFHQEIEKDLALVLNVDRNVVSANSEFIKTHLTKLVQSLLRVTSDATKDMVSVRISLALGSQGDCKATRQWGIGTEEDTVVSDWAFGLVKVDQRGNQTTLRPGAVMTEVIFKETRTTP